MLIEISLMQRLIVVLGHPTYGLSVVLFALLLGSGAGSFLTRNVTVETAGRAGRVRLAWLVATLVVVALGAPPAIRSLQSAADRGPGIGRRGPACGTRASHGAGLPPGHETGRRP